MQPNPQDYAYDLDRALASVVAVRARIPADAFTAQTLGTERAGHGVMIRNDGLVLTIGYLITEAESVYLTLAGGRVVPGHVLAIDQETGFGLVQPLARLEVSPIAIGSSSATKVGDDVVVAGAGGRAHAVAARIISKQEFAGYWEYVLDEAIFTAPAHTNWGGAALLGSAGELLGIGSLQIQRSEDGERQEDVNMIVPIDLLKPIQDDLLQIGRRKQAARPWLGLYASEMEGAIAVLGLAPRGPSQQARLKVGDVILDVGGRQVTSLADLFRQVWSLGQAGVDVPMTISREGRVQSVHIRSGDRRAFLKAPQLH